MTEDFQIYQTGPTAKMVADSVKNVDYPGFRIRYTLAIRGKLLPINIGVSVK